MNIEVVECDEETVTGSPELWVIVRSNEIFDLPQVMKWITEHHPGLWGTYRQDRKIFWPYWVSKEEREAEGFRFCDYWIFEKRATA